MIRRYTDCPADIAHVNSILNHPDVHPHVAMNNDPLDVTEMLGRPSVYALFGQHGGQIYEQIGESGIYDVHSAYLPEARGAVALSMTRETLLWMFAKTNAVEIMTRCPRGNLPAKALARAVGMRDVLIAPEGWVRDGKPIPCDIMSLTVQDWTRTAPGLEERGRWFHERLEAEFDRLGISELAHEDDATHDRYVGAACEMVMGGQPIKGAVFYNRVAFMMRWHPVSVARFDPLLIDIGSALLLIGDNDFTVVQPPKMRAGERKDADEVTTCQ